MNSEEQWTLVGHCTYCRCAIYERDGKYRYTSDDPECRCRAREEEPGLYDFNLYGGEWGDKDEGEPHPNINEDREER